MNLSRRIVAEVEATSRLGFFPIHVAVESGTNRLELHLTAAAPCGVAFDVLRFATSVRITWNTQELKERGDRLAKKLTYLMEPLVVLEVDDEAGQVEMRSLTPTARESRRTYYELLLSRYGTLDLRRIAFDEVTRTRFPIPCQLTSEAIERLTDDLEQCLA